MGSRSSKLDPQQGRHAAAPPFQNSDINLFDNPYKSQLLTSAIPVSSSLYEGTYGAFPDELPERPRKPSRFSLARRKAPLSTLTSPSTPAFSHSPPVLISSSDLTTFTGKAEVRPCYGPDWISTLPPPPTSPARLHRKPLPVTNVSHDLRPSISSPTLFTPKKGPHVKKSGINSDLPGDPALDPLAHRLAKLRLKPSNSTLSPHSPASPSSLSIQDEIDPSHLGSRNTMAGPLRKSRRLMKEDAQSQPPLEAKPKPTSKRHRPRQLGQVYDSQDSPPRKSRRNDRGQLKELEQLSYPDITARASDSSRSRMVSMPAKPVRKFELDQDDNGGISIEVPKVLKLSDSPMSMSTSLDADEWKDSLDARQLQQAENDILLEDHALPVIRKPYKRTKAGRNHPLSTKEKIRISPRGSANQGTKDDPIALSSDLELNVQETDSMCARRLDQEARDELELRENRIRTQQEADAAMAQRLEQEQKDEEKKQQEEEEHERLRVEEAEREILRLEEDERERQRYRDCAVCGENIHLIDYPSLAYCIHEPETCAECYASWITSEIKDGSWREIKCPGNKCSVVLENHEIQQFATAEDFDQLGNLLLRDALSTDPNFRWCRGRGCQSGHVHEGGNDDNIWRCGDCGFRVCVIHDNTWHEGETCTEYDYRMTGQKEKDEQKRKEQEAASLKAIGKMSKMCPGKECGWNIQKNDGCDHMTCSKCRHEFCWVCLAPYDAIRTTGNAAHNNACKYHSSRIR